MNTNAKMPNISGSMQLSPEAIKSAEDMLCLNEIPKTPLPSPAAD